MSDSAREEKLSEKLFVKDKDQRPRFSPAPDRKPFLSSIHSPGHHHDSFRSPLATSGGARTLFGAGGTPQRQQQKKTMMMIDFDEEKAIFDASKKPKLSAAAAATAAGPFQNLKKIYLF